MRNELHAQTEWLWAGFECCATFPCPSSSKPAGERGEATSGADLLTTNSSLRLPWTGPRDVQRVKLKQRGGHTAVHWPCIRI